jgi:hypothetical protein
LYTCQSQRRWHVPAGLLPPLDRRLLCDQDWPGFSVTHGSLPTLAQPSPACRVSVLHGYEGPQPSRTGSKDIAAGTTHRGTIDVARIDGIGRVHKSKVLACKAPLSRDRATPNPTWHHSLKMTGGMDGLVAIRRRLPRLLPRSNANA